MGGWALSGADVQAPWHGVLKTVWLHCDEAQQVGCLRGLEDCLLVWDASILSQFARRRWWRGRCGGYELCGAKQACSTVRLSSYRRTKARVAIRRVVAPAPQPEPASRLGSPPRVVSFLRSDSRCRRYVNDLSNVTPRYLGSDQKGRVSLLYLTFSSRLASFLLRWKAANTVFVVLSFSFQVWRYSPTVAMSLLSTPSTACQSPSACMIARSSLYAYFLETVVGRSEM